MNETVRKDFVSRIEEIRSSGLYKDERVIGSPQGAWVTVGGYQ